MHDCQHHKQTTPHQSAFMWGIGLNLFFVMAEGICGYFSNSLALMSDAGHNLSDVAGLIIAWAAIWLSQKNPTRHYTFGFIKSSIFSAFFNALFLMMAVGIILTHALKRLWLPEIVDYKMVMIVATLGIIINSFTAYLFFKNKDHDMNIKAAFLHLAADALISLGVVISGAIMYYTQWNWPDPFISIIISLIIIYGTWDLFKNSIRLSMNAVPLGIDPLAVKKYFENIEDIHEVHDLHIWALSTTETALSVHLTIKNNYLNNQKIFSINNDLKTKFNIHHPTIQVELFDQNFECHFKPDHVI